MLRISNKGNTILLRGKYDIVEREIRCFDKCHVGLFDQSNFYISRINIIERNKIVRYIYILWKGYCHIRVHTHISDVGRSTTDCVRSIVM